MRRTSSSAYVARGDSQEIAAWLANHFYRHVIGNLDADPPAVQPISTQAELLRLHRRTEPAAWALERLRAHAARQPPPHESPAAGASAPLWWVEPDSAPLLALESRLLEFLSTRRGTALQGKLQRINCPQALARWTLEHLAFARKRKRLGRAPARRRASAAARPVGRVRGIRCPKPGPARRNGL